MTWWSNEVPKTSINVLSNMIRDALTNSAIFGLLVRRPYAINRACMGQRFGHDIGPNAGLVVMKLAVITSVEHTIDFEDI